MCQMFIKEKLNFKIFRGCMLPDPLMYSRRQRSLAGPTLNCFRRACETVLFTSYLTGNLETLSEECKSLSSYHFVYFFLKVRLVFL